MTAFYLYGLIRAEDGARVEAAADRLTPIRGLGPIVVLRHGRIAAIASAAGAADDDQELAPTRRHLSAHARLLEACLPLGPLLPVRFGVVSRQIHDLEAWLDESETGLLGLLERFEGKVEFGLRILAARNAAIAAVVAEAPELARTWRAVEARGPAARLERIDLGRRVAETLSRRRDAAQRRLLARLARHADDHVVLPPEEDVEVLRASFLIPIDGEEEFERHVLEAVAALDFTPGLLPATRMVGPAPVSNFVSLRIGTGASALVPAG